MKTILIILVCFFSHSILIAQDFQILSQLQIDDNYSIATLRYDRGKYGIGLLNSKGIMTREEELKSTPRDIGLMGNNNLLLINARKKNIKTIAYDALLINKKSLAVIGEQELFTKKNSNQISYALLKDSYNNFCYALFRETKSDEGFSVLPPVIKELEYLASASFQLVSLNNKLESKIIDIKTEAANSYFAGACADAARNIYISSFTNNAIVVEKFDSTGKLLDKLTSPFSIWKNPDFEFIMKNDPINQGCITMACVCLNADKQTAHHVFRFDFINKKILKSGEIILNKEYCQSLKNTNEEAKGKHFVDMYGLKPAQILEDTNRIIVVKEIRTRQLGGKGEATTYFREGSIITLYNKKTLEVERDFVIDKSLATFFEDSEGINARLFDKYLWAVTCENAGLTSYKTYVNKINLISGEVTKVEIQKEDIGKGFLTFPGQIAWFKSNYVVPFFKVASFTSLNFETLFVVRPY